MTSRSELPSDFISQMQALLPDYETFATALEQPASVAVRLNPFKTNPLNQPSLLWCPLAYALPERPVFALDPRWHAGAYYVQDASCMLLEAVLKQLDLKPQLILDACAAPGGKATHLAALYPDALILANEVIKSRASILCENTSKWGSPNLAISRLDPSAFSSVPESFDLILADVPCSGEGLFRKDAAARKEWSLAHVSLCASRQQRILGELWASLKPDGVLIYSTCTYNHSENEAQVEWLKTEWGAESISWELPISWPIVQQDGCLRCYPHLAGGEGFFLSALRKVPAPRHNRVARVKPARQESLPARESQSLQKWLKDDFCLSRQGDTVRAWPQKLQEPLQRLSGLKHFSIGLPVAEIKGRREQDLRPAAELALSTGLNHQAFPKLELSLTQAISYLQGEALYDLPAGQEGYTLARFQGWTLGWLKRTEQRANNLYPQGWRLRMHPPPDEVRQAWEALERLLPLQSK